MPKKRKSHAKSKSGRTYRRHPKTGKWVLVRGHMAKNPSSRGKHRVRGHRARRPRRRR
jgi:galactose-1-phosphate uridylyltransferase